MFRLAGFALLLSVLLLISYLMIIGLPEPLARKITTELRKKGIPIQIDSISLSAHRGWVLHNARIYSPDPDNLQPLLQTDKLYLFIWPEDWTPLSRTEWRIGLYSKQTAVSLGLPWERTLDKENPFRTIGRFHARLQVDPSGLTVDSAQINWGGYTLNADGHVAFSNQKQPAQPASYSSFQAYAPQVADVLAGLMFGTPPEISLHFNVSADDPAKIQAEVSLRAAEFQRRGRFYKQITGEAHLRNSELQIDSLQIDQQDDRQLQLAGRYSLSSQTAQMELNNTLMLSDLLGLLPTGTAAQIGSSGLLSSETAQFSAVCGPCPPKQLLEQLRVQIHNLPVTYQDLTFNPLRFDLARDGDRIEAKNIQAQTDGHSLSGSFGMDLGSGAWQFSARGRVPTAPIGKLLGGTAQEWIDRFDFTNRFPDVTADVSRGESKGTFQMRSTVSGRDLLCAGIPLDSIDFTMTYSNRTFALAPLHASRGDRAFSGTIKLGLDQHRASFTADNSFPPDAVSRIIAPGHPTVLTNFTFTGPLTSSAAGWIDYGGGTDHSVQGSISATTVSAGRLTAQSFQSRVEARGSHLIFTNSTMNIFRGSAKGSAVFDLNFNDQIAPYQLNIAATELDLASALQHFGAKEKGSATGRLSATIQITADAKKGFWASANGRGTAEIKNGQLHDLPILGGFSRLIRTTLPGFSLFSLTTFYSDYQLHDGLLYSDNVQLGGSLLSARANGNYSPDTGLNFTVRAEPLRQTRQDKDWYQLHLWAADVLKKGTAPFFDLLEFRVSGPLQQPVWRMKTLPKEAYDLLEKLTPFSSQE